MLQRMKAEIVHVTSAGAVTHFKLTTVIRVLCWCLSSNTNIRKKS